MIKVKANDDTTTLEMYGSGPELAKQLHRIVHHVAEKLLQLSDPEKQKGAAEILALGMAAAVKDAYTEVRKEGVKHDDACHESMAH